MTRSHDTPADLPRPDRRGPHWAALAAAVFTWPLLLVGGSVTVYRVGMAVPDWPTTFGVNMFLYDFLRSPWGVYLEHTHRLYGSAVGLACIVLACWVTLAEVRLRPALLMIGALLGAGLLARVPAVGELLGGHSPFLTAMTLMGSVSLGLAAWQGLIRRRAVLGLAWFALAAVIVQGVLGGLRVTRNSVDLAMLHGCAAQAIFGLMVVLCVLTGRRWILPPRGTADTANLRLHAPVTLALVFAQIVLGAWLRHHGSTAALGLHAGFAAAVALHATLTARLALRHRELAPVSRAILATVAAQVLLGVLAWWLLRPFDGIARPVWPAQAAVRIAHQGIGALLLAASVILTMRAFRQFGPVARPVPDAGPESTAAAPRDLEAVV